MEIKPLGDNALSVEFENKIHPTTNDKVMCLYQSIKAKQMDVIIEMVPSFRSLLVYYNPMKTSFSSLKRKIKKISSSAIGTKERSYQIFEIPVCYEGIYAPDMETVSTHSGLSYQEIIQIHSKPEYLIYMLGFLPGFAYLGGLDQRIHTPRLENPRTMIPAGSVGIGGEQTGIYPLASPGGWQLIGRTPVKPYDINQNKPVLYQAGDYIKFIPIKVSEYERLENLQKQGEKIYQIRIGGNSK